MHAICKKNNHTLVSGKDREIWLSVQLFLKAVTRQSSSQISRSLPEAGALSKAKRKIVHLMLSDGMVEEYENSRYWTSADGED